MLSATMVDPTKSAPPTASFSVNLSRIAITRPPANHGQRRRCTGRPALSRAACFNDGLDFSLREGTVDVLHLVNLACEELIRAVRAALNNRADGERISLAVIVLNRARDGQRRACVHYAVLVPLH